MLRKTLLGVAASGAAVLASFGLASPAMAGTNASTYTNDGYPDRGWASFRHDGDQFQVCDLDADGWGVRGELRAYYPSTGNWELVLTLSDPSNDGTCVVQNRNFDEGRKVRVTVFRYKSGSPNEAHASAEGVA